MILSLELFINSTWHGLEHSNTTGSTRFSSPKGRAACSGARTCSRVLPCSRFHLNLTAFRATWYRGQSSIPRCRLFCLLNPKSLPDIVLRLSSWEMQDVIISPLLWIDCCDITLTMETLKFLLMWPSPKSS